MGKVRTNFKQRLLKPMKQKQILIMPLITLLLWLAGTFPAFSQGKEHKFPNENLQGRLERIIKEGDVTVSYTAEMVKGIKVPALSSRENKPEQWLGASLRNTGLSYSAVSGNMFAIIKAQQRSAAPVAPQQAPTGRGTISGTVIDANGEPVIGATVTIPGTTIGTATNVDGKYTLRGVPEGTTKVQFAFMGYETQMVSDVRVTANRSTSLDVAMKESSQQLGEVVVTATYNQAATATLLAMQKERVALSDGISADIIKKTSDNNLAQVMRRITGISVNDGKFVTVRGLSERYNNVTLNGASMPSTEPNRKNFNFHLLPTALVDNVVVVKSFTPDMSAEFVGGGLEINTLSYVEKPFLNVSVGSGWNSNSVGKDFWGGKRFGSDYLLGNNSERYWMGRDWVMGEYTKYIRWDFFENPEAYMKATRMSAKVPGWGWALNKTTGAPVGNTSVSLGKTFSFGEHKLSLIGGGSYRHEENIQTFGNNNILDPDLAEMGYNGLAMYESHRYEFTTSLSAVGNITWNWRGQRVSWKNLFTNRFVNESVIENGYDDNDGVDYVAISNSPQRQYIIQTRLEGEHQLLKGLQANWYWDFTQMNQDRPDERQVMGTANNGRNHEGYISDVYWGRLALGTQPGAYDHIYSYGLTEFKRNVGASLQYKFNFKDNEQMVKAGYENNNRDAHFMQYWVNVGHVSHTGDELQTQIPVTPSPGQIAFHDNEGLADYYSPRNFANGLLQLTPWGNNADGDGYDGNLTVNSVYLMGTFKFWNERITLSGGVRNERAKFNSIAPSNTPDTVSYDKSDWFPSINISVEPIKNLVVRASYNKTIARFDFRETAPVVYYDPILKYDVVGNDSLQNTHITNFDARAEWYPAAGEVVSVGFFIKNFSDPIEQYVSDPASNQQWLSQPVNMKSAAGKGFEVNFRKNLGFIAPGSFLKDLWLSGNLMMMNMTVTVPKNGGWQGETRKRTLQELVPYTINGMLSYEGKLFGAALSYGTTGRKLIQAGLNEKEDAYENPRHLLDFQLSTQLLKNKMEIKFNISDILATPTYRYMNKGFKNKPQWGPSDGNLPYLDNMNYNKGMDWLLESTRRGTSYSMSVNYKF